MILKEMQKKKLINPPDFLVANTMFVGITGSYAYGMSNNKSDMDLYGFCIPPKHIVFPHLSGEIQGFGTQAPRFNEFIKHHINMDEKEYDVTIFNIVRFFQLCLENNPNMLDVLYLPRDCIVHTTVVGEMIRDRRDLFISKLCVPKFKGYAFGQLSKLGRENYEPTGKRYELVQKYGYDTKNAAHVYRLLLQCEQVLKEGTMDLRRNAEELKAVRVGEYTRDQVEEFFRIKDKTLNELAAQSKLPERPPEEAIKKLLIECLEHHYGQVGDLFVHDVYVDVVNQIKALVGKL